MSRVAILWTDERIAEAVRLQKVEGKSSREIGLILGATRDAVLGVIYRHNHPKTYTGFAPKPRPVREAPTGPPDPVWGAWALENPDDLRRAIWARAKRGARATRQALG